MQLEIKLSQICKVHFIKCPGGKPPPWISAICLHSLAIYVAFRGPDVPHLRQPIPFLHHSSQYREKRPQSIVNIT
ncbi:uncharacterized protein Dyak_GE28288 [Drosophila yakuba]|uniref:Uncharacterized protein n=1 Tax=Drosophila yakuba TaxID=7245 RepID=A0A0R1DX64_DROYA|nr:uncharacterized protein Dyak_GE28288 [Drosophila yakuba]